jgi:uncharacterized SAM-binding protein YcdF (DUF218 family)
MRPKRWQDAVFYFISLIYRLIRLCVYVWGITFIAVLGWTYLWPIYKPMPQGDVIICLGAGMTQDHGLGPGSIMRAETCGALYRAGAAPLVVFTGGHPLPTNPTVQNPSSAATMAQVSGIPPHDVILEHHAQSTLQNALFTRPYYENDQRIIIVTETFHLPRAGVSFAAFGARDIDLYPAGRIRQGGGITLLMRETLAIWFNLGRGMIYAAGGLLGVGDNIRVGWLH